MINGTFREWVENDTPGTFTNTDASGLTASVQLAEYQPGHITYEVTIGGQWADGSLWAKEFAYNATAEIVAQGFLTWDTVGDVIDG